MILNVQGVCRLYTNSRSFYVKKFSVHSLCYLQKSNQQPQEPALRLNMGFIQYCLSKVRLTIYLLLSSE